MVTAALVSFAILLLAWLVAPDRQRTRSTAGIVATEVEPIAA